MYTATRQLIRANPHSITKRDCESEWSCIENASQNENISAKFWIRFHLLFYISIFPSAMHFSWWSTIVFV